MQKLLVGFFWLLIAAVAAPARAQADKFVEGRDYERVSPSALAVQSTSDIVEVDYFFMARCRVCIALEADYQAWLKLQPPDVHVVRVQYPGYVDAKFGDEAPTAEARGWYTAVILNVADALFPAMNDALKQGWALDTEEEWIEFFSDNGIDPEVASRVFRSNDVTDMRRQADNLWQGYGIRHAPDFVVGGRYKSTSSFINRAKDQLEFVDFLVAKVRAERAAAP